MFDNNEGLQRIDFMYSFNQESDHILETYYIYNDSGTSTLEYKKVTAEGKQEHVELTTKKITDESVIKQFFKDIKKATRFWSGNYTNAASNALWYTQQGYAWRIRCRKPSIVHFGKDHKPKNFDEVVLIINKLFERGSLE